MPDPGTAITAAGIAATVAQGAKAAGLDAALGDFLKRILGPIGDDIGESLAALRRKREETLATIGCRAKEMAEAAGLEAREIPLRLLAPIMEGASVEDDASMQERWAALLANAATDAGESLSPLLARSLAQLTPLSALLLETLWQLRTGQISTIRARTLGDNPNGVSFAQWYGAAGITPDGKAMAAIDVLMSLGLVHRDVLHRSVHVDGVGALAAGSSTGWELSSLGDLAVRAFQPPTSRT